MSGITPCLWFDGKAEEAAQFYASVFHNSHVDAVHRAPSDYGTQRRARVQGKTQCCKKVNGRSRRAEALAESRLPISNQRRGR